MDSAGAADVDLFFEDVRFFEGVGTLPLLLGDSSLSSPRPASAAFCRRVRALIVDLDGLWSIQGETGGPTLSRLPDVFSIVDTGGVLGGQDGGYRSGYASKVRARLGAVGDGWVPQGTTQRGQTYLEVSKAISTALPDKDDKKERQ